MTEASQKSSASTGSLRRRKTQPERWPVDVQTHASRLRYIADYLDFISNYFGEGLARTDRLDLEAETERALTAFREHIPGGVNFSSAPTLLSLKEETEYLLQQAKRC